MNPHVTWLGVTVAPTGNSAACYTACELACMKETGGVYVPGVTTYCAAKCFDDSGCVIPPNNPGAVLDLPGTVLPPKQPPATVPSTTPGPPKPTTKPSVKPSKACPAGQQRSPNGSCVPSDLGKSFARNIYWEVGLVLVPLLALGFYATRPK